MAKFCRFCGKELAEGMNCDCPQSQTQPEQTAFQQPVVQKTNIDFKGEALNVWQYLKTMLKKPEATSSNLTKTSDAKQALILIGVQSVLTAILMCVMAGQYNGLFEDAGRMAESMKFSLISVFLITFICSAGMAAAVAGIMMGVVKIFKGNVTYQQTLCISSANSIILMPFIVLAIVYAVLFGFDAGDVMALSGIEDPTEGMNALFGMVRSIFIPIVISMIGCTLGQYIMKSVLKDNNYVDKERAAYVIFITFIVSAIVLYFVIDIGFSACAPKAFKALGALM